MDERAASPGAGAFPRARRRVAGIPGTSRLAVSDGQAIMAIPAGWFVAQADAALGVARRSAAAMWPWCVLIDAMMPASGRLSEAGRTLGRCAMRRLSVLLSAVVVVSLVSAVNGVLPRVAAQDASPAASTPCPATTEDANEALVRRYLEEAWNQGKVEVLDEVWAETPDLQAPVTRLMTRDDLKARILAFRSAFPDLRAEVKFILTEDDAVVAGVARTGTHLGEFDGIPPTGLTADWTGIEMFHIACGHIVAEWIEANALDLRRDLGIITEEELASVAPPEATPAP